MSKIIRPDETLFMSCKEPPKVRALMLKVDPHAESDTLPDEYGSDFLWATPWGFAGVQRKQFPNDFLDSLWEGDRMDRELIAMTQIESPWRFLILEGQPRWNNDGELLDWKGRTYTLWEMRPYLWSLAMFSGIQSFWTTSITDTCLAVKALQRWTLKPEHKGMGARNKMRNIDPVEWALQALPGMGRKRAADLVAFCRCPIIWNPELRLEDAPGIGKGLATRFRTLLSAERDQA